MNLSIKKNVILACLLTAILSVFDSASSYAGYWPRPWCQNFASQKLLGTSMLPETIQFKGEHYKVIKKLGSGYESDVFLGVSTTGVQATFKQYKLVRHLPFGETMKFDDTSPENVMSPHYRLVELSKTAPKITLVDEFTDVDPSIYTARYSYVEGSSVEEVLESNIPSLEKGYLRAWLKIWKIQNHISPGFPNRNILLEFKTGRFFIIDLY